MSRAVEPGGGVTPTEAMPDDGTVRHFDELGEQAQQYLIRAVDGGSPRDPSTVPGLSEGDVVVFTDYYRIG